MTAKHLADASRSDLHHLPREHRAALEMVAVSLSIRHVDLSGYNCLADVLGELGRALDFPDWYGRNLDALNDCLTDPDWQAAQGCLIFLDGLATLRLNQPTDFATLVEVLQSAATAWRHTGTPFWILLDTAADGVTPFPSA